MSMDVGGSKGGVKSDINVTPLVDVMLVLLIIMMLVAPMLQKGVDVKLPQAANTTDKPDTQGQTVVGIQANKQIFLITDGKPSAIWEHGRLYKNPFGLDLKIVNRTLEEADACRRDGITITTFMIATDTYLVEFVDKLTRINRGRAYYASPYNLAEFLFTDYIRNRKKFLH